MNLLRYHLAIEKNPDIARLPPSELAHIHILHILHIYTYLTSYLANKRMETSNRTYYYFQRNNEVWMVDRKW